MSRSLAAALALVLAGCGGGPGAARVLSVPIERKDLVLDVEVTGTLRSLESESVGPPPATEMWDFKITRLAPEGTTVKPGDEVIAFDPSDLEKRLKDYESKVARLTQEIGEKRATAALAAIDDRRDLEQAEARWRTAELKADKPQDLTAAREAQLARSERDLARREVELKRQRGQAKRRQEAADLTELEARLDHAGSAVTQLRASVVSMSVKARRAGTVVYKPDRRGEKRSVGDTTWRGGVVLEVTSLSLMAAQGQVHEVDASKVAVGQHVGLRLESSPDKEYRGRVERVDSLVVTESPESKIKVAQLDIQLAETDPLLMRPYSRFRGHVEIERVPGVLQVPVAAIESTADGPVVTRVAGDGALRRVPVRLGRRGRQTVEVLAGLAAGDRVQLGAEQAAADQAAGRASGGTR